MAEQRSEQKTKVRLVHRRKDLEMKEFDDEKEARKYAKDQRYIVVHEDRDPDGTLNIRYLPE